MDRRAPPCCRARGGEGIPSTRPTLGLGAASLALAAGLAGWLTLAAGPDAVWPVEVVGTIAVIGLAVTLAVGRAVPIAGVLALLGAGYTLILVIDNPPLDARAAFVAAALLAIGELGYLSVEARTAVAGEAGAVARRVGYVAVAVLLAVSVGGALVALVDVLRTGGPVIEVVGAVAAVGAVGLLARAAHEARTRDGRDRSG